MKSAAESRSILVLEIGGTTTKIGFIRDREPQAYTRRHPTAAIRSADIIEALARLTREAVAEAGIAAEAVVATVPGFMAADKDLVLYAANVPELNGRRLASELADRLGIPTMLEHDVALQLLGEQCAGSVVGLQHILGIYFGTGIGAAYLGEQGVFRGGGWALQVGHAPFAAQGQGRLEDHASGLALSALAHAHGLPIAALFKSARESSTLAERLADILRYQALAVATAIAHFAPRVVVLGGGVIEMQGFPREQLLAQIEACYPFPPVVMALDIRWASLGWRAALYGAAMLVETSGGV